MYEIKPGIITVDDILNKVSQEEIWEYYLGFPIEEGKLFLSPLRDEDSPSANMFYARDGTLLLKDFGLKTMNVWQFIMYVYDITFHEALLKASTDLCIHDGTRSLIPPQRKTPKKRDRVSIEVRVKRWTIDTLEYWTRYSITKETLRLFNVVAIDRLWISGEFLPLKQPAYSYEFNKGYRKIYCPESDKMKFISNVPGYMYSGYEQLPWIGDLLILTKSHKDVMVWHELGYNAISPQGEGHKIEFEFMQMLKKRFKTIVLNYDNDRAGKLYSKPLAEEYEMALLYIEDHKDISDYMEEYKMEQTKIKVKEWINTLL